MIQPGHAGRALVEAVGEQPFNAARDLDPRLSDFDWGDTEPYLMFFTGRCGSTWLTNLLAHTGMAGNPQEFFNTDVVAAHQSGHWDTLSGYLHDMVATYASGVTTGTQRFGMQVDVDRLREIGGVVDWRTVFPPERPSFFLYRRDLLAQAWSWASAAKSQRWHTSQGTQSGHAKAPTEAELIEQILRLRRNEEWAEEFFDRAGYRPLYLDYESLVTDPGTTVATILRHLGATNLEQAEEPDGGGQSRLVYGTKAVALAEFSERHRPVLDLLHRHRLTLTADDLAALF